MRATLEVKNTTKSWVSHTVCGDIYHDGQAFDNVELAIKIQHFNKEQIDNIYNVVDEYFDALGDFNGNTKKAYGKLYRLACQLHVKTLDLIEWVEF